MLLSGYVTVRDCEAQQYPYKECIHSLLQFCDEVVVLDGGSTDDTFKYLKKFSSKEKKIT